MTKQWEMRPRRRPCEVPAHGHWCWILTANDYARPSVTGRDPGSEPTGGAQMTGSATPDQEQVAKLNTNVPHSARVWNYWLGGKDNFAADRQVGDQVRAVFPGIVDNDPLVLAHARALLVGSPEGATDYLDADVHDPDTILHEAARTLDFTQPVAVMMLGILGFVGSYAEARSIVTRLLEGVPSGSYLVIADGTNTSGEIVEAARVSNAGGHHYTLRSPQEIAGFFAGLEVVEPGVVSVSRWRPEPGPSGVPAELHGFCGIARKP